MFCDLNIQGIVPNEIEADVPEFYFSSSLREKIQNALLLEEPYVKICEYTSVVKSDNNYVFFPNQWFYLAVICKKYAEALYPYCVFFDSRIRCNSEISNAITNKQFDNYQFCNLFDSNEDRDRMVRFILADPSYRPGKALINTRDDKKVLRSCRDVFGSCILKKITVPDASSAYLGNLVYYLAKNKELYDEIEAEVNNCLVNTSNIVTSFDFLGNNILLYGVPGCGKSYTIKTKYCNDESVMERIVFHPDYTNSDFIGQILPVNNEGKITYEYKPGPFTRILRKAYENPKKMHYLVIEEINRGNAPAIFGEVFQLLDRVDGESEYGINNPDIAAEVFGDPESLVKIPSNLTILATMNTADQNVFTLDTAFKRRWNMVSIPNDFEKCKLKDTTIGNTNVKWPSFAKTINYLIVDNSLSTVSSEDKRLGAYFASEEQLKDPRKFAEKVLAYLWDDVFKFDRTKVFRADIRTLDELILEFVENGIDAFESTVKKTLLDEALNGATII